MIVCPVYISSTWPLTSPRYFCWSWKNPCEREMTILMMNIDAGSIRSAMTVIIGLMLSIMISMHKTVAALDIVCVMLFRSVWLIVSISFMKRLWISPCVLLSKYLSGSLSSFSDIWRRSLYVISCDTLAMMNPWRNEHSHATANSPIRKRMTLPSLEKSIAPAFSPSTMTSVALPRTARPIVFRHVAAIAKMKTMMTRNLYSAR